MTVDEFVKARVLPEFQPVVVVLREFMREAVPDAKEEVSYGIPVYKRRKIFALISPTKKDFTFSFTHGGEFEDRYHLLRGEGKIARHIKLKNVQDVNKEVLLYYIKRALELEAK